MMTSAAKGETPPALRVLILYEEYARYGTPTLARTLVGALDSSGFFFLEGDIERSADGLSGFVAFKWQLEDDRLVPFTRHVLGDDKIDVQMTSRGMPATSFNEIWQLSNVTR